ncbi:MAG: hypothetical protein KDJ80_16305 [Nitratireductor sp.]|nr:hypothetical protein [Nitratireductor sp.]
MTRKPEQKPERGPGLAPEQGEDEREAKRILDRVARDSETIGTSSLARGVNQLHRPFDGIDGNADDRDPVAVIGKRIGRGLGLLAVIGLIVHLAVTYVFR